MGPKIATEQSRGIRLHAMHRVNTSGVPEWEFEERGCSLANTNMSLVRVIIGKIEDKDRMLGILRRIPIRKDEAGWNCVSWVKEAIEALQADGKALGTSILDWKKVSSEAMAYCQRKKDQHRFDGQGQFNMQKVATYDLLEGKEIQV